MSDRIETLKKAAFLHDLGKLLNWSGELHLLDGARVLKHLGFDDTVVGLALYHEPDKKMRSGKHKDKTYREVLELCIQSNDCPGLKPYAEYDEYALVLGELVDKLMAGFDRLGEGRERPVVLRNPLTHLPLNGQLHQFQDTINRGDCSGTGESYMREFVRTRYLPNASLKSLDAQPGDCVYALDDELKRAPLLKPLVEHVEGQSDFNALYRALSEDDGWQALTRHWIPQGHTPPTDTLALWYHMQFSSALAGLYWAEGFRTADQIKAELDRRKKQPLEVKIGLLYIRIAGLTEYFATAYRLPDFSGTEATADALKETVKEQLLAARHNDEPIVWEDSFLYEGHDDFLVMVPVETLGARDEDGDYAYRVGDDDPFMEAVNLTLLN